MLLLVACFGHEILPTSPVWLSIQLLRPKVPFGTEP